MVQGHPHIKMCTSIIDYIFRELAVNYLGRNDLAHVAPDDLAPDTTGSGKEDGMEAGIDYRDEEIIEEHIVSPGPLRLASKAPGAGFLAEAARKIEFEDRSSNSTYPAKGRNGNGNGNGHRPQAVRPEAVRPEAAAKKSELQAAAQLSMTIQRAKMQGYEGDACPSCHSFTMVRNGSCLKCETCGNTSGCS
jgi:ribonucleoside-diphosphate reductase alpha chain